MEKVRNICCAVIGFTSSLALLRFGAFSYFKIAIVASIAVLLLCGKGKIEIGKLNPIYIWGFVLLMFTTIGAVVFPVGSIWSKQAKVMFFWMSAYFLFYALSTKLSCLDLKQYFRFFYYGGIVQVAWCVVQFFWFATMGMDLNLMVFRSFFDVNKAGTYFKEGVYGVSGLAWHPTNMAPLLIIVYWMTSNIYVKFLVVLVGLMTNNATVIIGVCFCAFIDVMRSRFHRRVTVNKKTLLGTCVILVVSVLAIALYNIDEWAISRFSYIYERIWGHHYDGGSTDAHIRYFTWIPKVFISFGLDKTFLGFGEGCSGYTMTVLRHQYDNFGAWALECDIANILWNRGLLGFVLFYSWLYSIAKKGKRVSTKYAKVMGIIFICGFFYNIQYDWVIVTELMMGLAIQNNVNIFEITSQKTKGMV